MNPLLRCAGLTKLFPGIRALHQVDFDVRAGEVHALAGENGAGKSTLMHLLAGVFPPDAGSIEIDGHGAVTIEDERHAQRLGIAIVYQERSLFPLLSIAENLFVNRQPAGAGGVIDRTALHAQARALLEEVNLAADPERPAGSLSPAQQQMLEIAKALSFHSRVLILDEPTAALTVAETDTLFRLIRQLKEKGVAIVYISHRLEEIFEIADRVGVLKDGEMQGTWKVADITQDGLVASMVGRARIHERAPRTVPAHSGAPALEVRNLSDSKLRDISFSAWAGEIVGFSGLAGAGRTELAMAIFGERAATKGEVLRNGRPVRIRSASEAIAAGIGYLPEDRKEQGLFLDMSIAANIAAARLDAFGGWRIDGSAMRRAASGFIEKLRIAAPNAEKPAGKLSGGNQQKVLFARWLLRDPEVLMVDEPTRGVDVGAKAEIYQVLRALADEGKAVIAISSDLPEVLAISDRILVMRQGRIAGELAGAGATEEAVMRLAATQVDRAA
jgi:ABC-type sugar transport system ATPase subunit